MKIINYEAYEHALNNDSHGLSEELKHNSMIQNLCQTRHIPLEQIDAHPTMWQNWLDQVSLCKGCQGLKHCKQRQNGYVEVLQYDGVLTSELEACAYRKKKQQLEQHLNQFLVNDLGETFYQASFQSVQREGEDPNYVRVWMETKKLCDEHLGAYIYGNMGTGKTYLAACAVNQLAREGKKIAFVHCPRFVERLLTSYRTGEYRTEVERLMYADFVVFDDIGAEDVSERYRSILLGILDARMQNHRMTWFTSNEDFTSLQDHFLTTSKGDDLNEAMRIMERIRTLAKPIELIGPNRRAFQDGSM